MALQWVVQEWDDYDEWHADVAGLGRAVLGEEVGGPGYVLQLDGMEGDGSLDALTLREAFQQAEERIKKHLKERIALMTAALQEIG